jgi:16S rRNA (guanine527-N7)-methyltransferase
VWVISFHVKHLMARTDSPELALESTWSDPALGRILTQSFVSQMATFAATLALWGAKMNLTARPDDPDEIAFHIVDSLMPLALLPDAFVAGKRVLDFGSGAGFPGLVLASACPARFTLVESRQKRTSFLQVAAAEMKLDNVEVLAARLRPRAVAPEFDVVLSRASGPPWTFYEIAARALIPRGFAVLYSNPSQRLDTAAAKRVGLGEYHRHRYSVRRGTARADRALATWRLLKKAE